MKVQSQKETIFWISIFTSLIVTHTGSSALSKNSVSRNPGNSISEYVPKSDLQVIMTSPLLANDEAARISFYRQRYKMVRLWPFDSDQDIAREVMTNNALEISNFDVAPRYCGSKTYAHFQNAAMIEANETKMLTEPLKELKMTSNERSMHDLYKVWKKGSELFPNFVPDAPAQLDKPRSATEDSKIFSAYKEEINTSSSLVEVVQNDDLSYLNSSDYTIGGWFKPDTSNNSNSMTLLAKFFRNEDQTESAPEWRVFFVGNIVYFQSFKDGFLNTSSRYLNEQEAFKFRKEHSDYYQKTDYMVDAVERLAEAQYRYKKSIAGSRPSIPTYLAPPIVPDEKGDVHKPVPVPIPLPPPVVVAPPGTQPPPGPVPYPKFPSGIAISGQGQVIKDHTLDIDLKAFWWSTSLGVCYGCIKKDVHSDVWHYIAASVHLNDPLGPYLDFWIIQDPNGRIFGPKATVQNNIRHLRLELSRNNHSFPTMNPFMNSGNIQKNCGDKDCIQSILQIGSINKNSPYSGYMRGVYLAKKALRESDVLDMAAQYYPDDSKVGCTYSRNFE